MQSPLPQKNTTKSKQLDFPAAIKELMEGKKITRTEWNDNGIYGFLDEGKVRIVWNGKHDWIISDGDLFATDWISI